MSRRGNRTAAARELTLRKFDITSVPDDSVIVFVGKRQTGKSFLVRDLLFYKQDIPVGTVVSGTEGANEFYSKIVPKSFIHGEYDESITERVLERQKRVVADMKRESRSLGGTDIDPRAIYLLDDCLYDKSWTRSKVVRSLFMNGRHWKIMFLITMQYSLGIPPNLRTNVDYVFILRESIIQNRRRLYDAYAGMFPTFDMFCRVMDECTEDYHCLVIHTNAKSNKLTDMVFWYKASPHAAFRFGHPSFWDYAATAAPDTDDDDDYGAGGASSSSSSSGLVRKGDYLGRIRRR